ncbi:MAG: hypothetical protein RL088_989 [Verrucomicrobiota bacterium]|jgi:hypothetical protein
MRILAAVFWITSSALAVTPAETATLKKFLSDYCVKCHGAEKQKGDIRLDDLSGDMLAEGTRWSVIADQIRRGEMPPDDAKAQPSDIQKKAVISWVHAQLGAHAQRKPNLGNLVPHDLLFAPASSEKSDAPAARLWRLSPEAYTGWVDQVGGRVNGIVQPFTANPERGIKDFSSLGRVDEPTTEILLRNAEAIVEKQTGTRIEDGKVIGKNDAVREFTDLIKSDASPSRELLTKAIDRQFQLAIARKAEPDEVQRLLGLYEKCAQGGDHAGALRTVLTAVLLRSDAMFRAEMGGPDGMLTPREAAGAISAALMHKRDGALFNAAEKGELTTREQIAAHVRRILDDPKIQKPRLLGFFREYFEYDNAPDVFKDEPKDLWHRPEQAVLDTDRLILQILAEDKDVFRTLLTTPLTFVNVKTGKNKETKQEEFQRAQVPNPQNQKGKAPIESLYGLTDWTPQQPITQSPGTRIGILMQPSWLVAWSENFNNDIVRRGRFIRERLLGGTVPDLPIGVAAMIPDDKTRTLRDRVTNTTKDERCWKCHQHMDDLGLPFEQFDHYGRMMTADLVLDPEATSKNVNYKGVPQGDVYKPAPLDTTGRISLTGDPKLDGAIKNPHELLMRIASSDRARQVWIRHVFRYYLGRNETLADAATLQAADRAYLQSGGSYKALLTSLLASDSFLKRRVGTPH